MRKSSTEFDRPITVAVLGPPESGKSLLINGLTRRVADQPNAGSMLSQNPVSPNAQIIVEVNSESRDYKQREYDLKRSNVVLVAADLGKPAAFPEAVRFAPEGSKIIVVRTMSDNPNAKKHPEYETQVKEMASSLGYAYVQTSARTGAGLDAVLEQALNPHVVEVPKREIPNKQAVSMLAGRPKETIEVSLSNVKVDAQDAIDRLFYSEDLNKNKSTRIATKYDKNNQLQFGKPNAKGEIAGPDFEIRSGEHNSITINLIEAPTKGEKATNCKAFLAEQVSRAANELNSGVTITVKNDSSGTLKSAIEDRLVKPFEPTPEKKAVVTIHGMEPFLQEIEKKGTAISSIAAGLVNPDFATNTHMSIDAQGNEKLTAHMVNSNSTMTVNISAADEPGERKIEIVHNAVEGKSLKEVVVVVNEMMDRCNAVASKAAAVTGQSPSDLMGNISIDTGKSGNAVKNAVDVALQRANLGSHLHQKAEPQQAQFMTRSK